MPQLPRPYETESEWKKPGSDRLRARKPPPIDRGRPPVYTLSSVLLPVVLLYVPAWLWPESSTLSVAAGLALVPVTMIAIVFAGLALRRHERWRWGGILALAANLAVFYLVVMRRQG